MENPNQQRLAHSSSGHESHGVYVCHKCGWPFPNPHPSAKHRRAHKRVCGTIEGYELGSVDLDGSSHSNLSDEERPSDGDPKTPSSKVMENEVYSDAATEFLDAAISEGARGDLKNSGESAINEEKDLINGPVAEAVKPIGNTTEIVQVQHSEATASTIDTVGNAPKLSKPSSSVVSTVSNGQTEDSALLPNSGGNISADDSKHMITEIQKDASLNYEKKTNDVDAISDGCSIPAKQRTDVEGKKETYLDISSPGNHIFPSKAAGELSDVIESLPSTPDDGLISTKIPETDVSPEVASLKHVNSDDFTGKKGADANVHVLSISDDLQEINNPKVMLEDFKDHQVNLNQSATSEFELASKIDDTGGLISLSNSSEVAPISSIGSHALLKEAPVEEESVLSQIDANINENKGSSEILVTKEVAVPVIDYGVTASALRISTQTVGEQDQGEAMSSDISGEYSSKGVIESDYTGSPASAPESAVSLPEVQVNQSTEREQCYAGSNEKINVEKASSTGDVFYEVSNQFKKESEVDNSGGQGKQTFLVIAPKSAKKFSELESDQETIIQADYEKVEIEKPNIANAPHDVVSGKVEDEIQVDNIDSSTMESFSKNLVAIPESANEVLEPSGDHAAETQKDEPVLQITATPESASHLQESHTVVEDECGSGEKLLESACPDSRSVDADPVADTKQIIAENIPDEHEKVREVTPSSNNEDNNGKELILPLTDCKFPNQSSSATGDTSTGELTDVVSTLGSESCQVESGQRQVGASVIGTSVDSSSRTDSLENNWGSVSVLSVQSDTQAATDAETILPTESQAATGERTSSRKSRPLSEGHNSDKSDIFEPPSFMTLVEPVGKNVENPTASGIEASNTSQQPKSSALQAGWFPSITHVVNESQGRKKNEEIIAKVTNWSTGKQHAPLKSLLGEASQDSRAKSLKRKENLAPTTQKGDKPATTVNSILAPESPLTLAADKEVGKEWNSPARYPTEIKREKRKPKSRPYWAQFMCCSSVH